MKDPEETFTIFEEYAYQTHGPAVLKRIYLGRLLASSERERGVLGRYSLKKREYINTTSMDAELAFLTANITLADAGKLFYDPFVGTGSFPIACAHFGARCWGSDIDGRMVRGKEIGGEKKDIRANFRQYGLVGMYVDGFVADLTNTPLRQARWLDGIVCDPPYGVRDGLKVLGHSEGRDRASQGVVWIDGEAAHLKESYVPPKRVYPLEAMLGDILLFAARMLVDGGRVSLWMPTANDMEEELAIPGHPALELLSVCVQVFNKWSRRLLTYRRVPGIDAEHADIEGMKARKGTTADDLNRFRRRYFQGFRNADQSVVEGSSATPHGQSQGQASLPEVAGANTDQTSLHEALTMEKRAAMKKSHKK